MNTDIPEGQFGHAAYIMGSIGRSEMTKHSTTMSALPPFHQDRYVAFSWPEDIQPHEAKFLEELFALQIDVIKRIAESNVAKAKAEDEYDSWRKAKA